MVIAFVAIFIIPFLSFAMTQVDDSELSTFTGQHGASINLDVNMSITASTIAWGDNDGFVFATASPNYTTNTQLAGWVGLSNLTIANLRIQERPDLQALAFGGWVTAMPIAQAYAIQETAIVGPAAAALAAKVGAYIVANPGWTPQYPSAFSPTNPYTWTSVDHGWLDGTTGAEQAAWTSAWATFTGTPAYANYQAYESLHPGVLAAVYAFPLPLTIDVATDTSGIITGFVGRTFVRIGLGSLQATMDSLDADVKVGTSHSLVGLSPNYDDTYGSLYVGNMTVLVNGVSSYVDIYKGSGAQSVVFNPHVYLDSITIGTVAWGDKNGLGTLIAGNPAPAGWVTGTAEGWVGLKNLTIGSLSVIGPIQVDVATYGGTTYVNIAFGTVAATIGTMDATVALGDAKTNLNQELGSIYVSGLTVTLGGAVKVMAHSGTTGVVIDLNTLTVAISGNPTISWGDSDGIGGTTTAGYVGITGLAISGLTIAGQVSIDVATVDTNTALVTSAKALMYAAYVSHNLTPSFVHIGLGTGDANDALTSANTMAVGITSLAANVVLGSDKGLTAGVGTMGQLYIGNLSAKLNGWVDIAAH